MNAQEIYDTVKAHLLKQNAKSTARSENGVELCRYRGDDGRMCAFGCLLTDEEAAASETNTVYDLVTTGKLPYRFAPHTDLLGRLQSVHDYNEPSAWPGMLAEVALKNGLTP